MMKKYNLIGINKGRYFNKPVKTMATEERFKCSHRFFINANAPLFLK